MGATNIVVGINSSSTFKVAGYGVAEGSAVDMGLFKGGVSIEHDESHYDVKVDQALGAVNKVITDESMKIKLSVSEASLANLAVAYGYETTAVSDSTFSFGDDQNVTFKTLYINVVGPGAGARKYTFWKCRPTGKTSQAYKRDGEVLVDVEFDVLCDTTKTAGQRFGKVEDSGADTTAPTIAMSTPASGGTRTAGGKTTVVLTITETNQMDEGSMVYGDTVSIFLEGDGIAASTLVAGSISYDSVAKTITFTPTENWEAGNYDVVVSIGLKDAAGNHLAAAYLGYFTVSA